MALDSCRKCGKEICPNLEWEKYKNTRMCQERLCYKCLIKQDTIQKEKEVKNGK